jgi:cytochrome c oxidase subunit 1
LLALTRWQAVHLLPADWYYRILTAHGFNMLIFFIIFFEMAVLHFAGPIMLGCRQPAPKLGWLGYLLMLIGACTTNFFVFAGKADVLFTSYVPLKAHPAYYLGIILFAVGRPDFDFALLCRHGGGQEGEIPTKVPFHWSPLERSRPPLSPSSL